MSAVSLTLEGVDLTFPPRAGLAAVEALRGIDLALREGDRVGLVGANGAGKSSLLRVMAGIYTPHRGRVIRSGRTVALLSLGLGIDVQLSGRKNIALLAMHLDIAPRTIRALIDEIIEWTELGRFIDAPLQTYSSGMLLRLMFAVSTALPPDILLLDEWLGIGDEQFQSKAYARIGNFVDKTEITVIATHSPEIRAKWCNRIIGLDLGAVQSDCRVNTGELGQ